MNANTAYTYIVEVVDGAGNAAKSASTGITTPPAPISGQILLGNQAIQSNVESLRKGQTEAFRATAVANGTSAMFSFYIDGGSSARNARVGLYSDNNNHPGTLLSQALLSSPRSGAWNTTSFPGASITAGQIYWFAVLNPQNTGGALKYRDSVTSTANRSETSYQNNLNSLPSVWRTGSVNNNGPISAYIAQQLILLDQPRRARRFVGRR